MDVYVRMLWKDTQKAESSDGITEEDDAYCIKILQEQE